MNTSTIATSLAELSYVHEQFCELLRINTWDIINAYNYLEGNRNVLKPDEAMDIVDILHDETVSSSRIVYILRKELQTSSVDRRTQLLDLVKQTNIKDKRNIKIYLALIYGGNDICQTKKTPIYIQSLDQLIQQGS